MATPRESGSLTTPTGTAAVAAMASVTLALGLVACTSDAPTDPEGLSCEQERGAVVAPVSRLDLLVVLDRTASAADLSAKTAALGEALAFVTDDLRIAVVTSELGATVAGCAAARRAPVVPDATRCGIDGPYLRHGPDPADRNYTGSLADAFACLVDVPTTTCPVSQPVAAALAVLDGEAPALADFQRFDRAHLAVAIVTDGDDCSLVRPDALVLPGGLAPGQLEAAVDAACFAQGNLCTPAAPTAPGEHTDCHHRPGGGLIDVVATEAVLTAHGGAIATLFALVAGPATVAVDAGGDLTATCGPGATVGGAAPRLHAFDDARLQRGRSEPMLSCPDDLALAIGHTLVQPFLTTLGLPCLDPSVDRAPEVPGVQATCAVVTTDAAGAEVEVLAACNDPARDPARPCYRFDPAFAAGLPECMPMFIDAGDQLTGERFARASCEIDCT